jgi:hypothetical protein
MTYIIERSTGHDRPRRQLRAAAGRGIEHPLRNLQRTVTIVRMAPKDRDATARDRRDDRDCTPKPRMPAIEDFSLLDNVGVLLSGCTIGSPPQLPRRLKPPSNSKPPTSRVDGVSTKSWELHLSRGRLLGASPRRQSSKDCDRRYREADDQPCERFQPSSSLRNPAQVAS